MSEKYTIVHGDVCYKDSGNHFNIVSAEWICRVLNEEEKRKSLPKIDTNMKEMIISFLLKKLKKNRRVFSTNKKELDDIEKLFFETINVIESLESQR